MSEKKDIWTEDKIIQLAEFYERNEHMWKKSSPEYFDRKKKKKSNLEIGQILKIDAEEINKKWRSLRQTFMKEVMWKKPRKSDSDRIKKKEWRFFGVLRFLLGEVTESGIDAWNMEDPLMLREEPVPGEELSTSNASKMATITHKHTSSVPKKRRPKDSVSDNIKENPVYIKCLSEKSNRDDFDKFGCQIANDLRRISEKNEKICTDVEIEIRVLILNAFKKLASKDCDTQ